MNDLQLAMLIEARRAQQRQALWQSIVSPKARYVRETPTAHVVLHPTKGLRFIGKRRLGEQVRQ